MTTEILTALSICVPIITACLSGLIAYFQAKKNAKMETEKLIKQHELDLEKIKADYQQDIERIKLEFNQKLLTMDKEFQHQLELKEKDNQSKIGTEMISTTFQKIMSSPSINDVIEQKIKEKFPNGKNRKR